MTYGAQQIAQTMTLADAWREIIERQISIVPSFDGRFWTASVDEKGKNIASRKRKVRMISATASAPIAAIEMLVEKLEMEAEPQYLEFVA
jgi:hypothetical protein